MMRRWAPPVCACCGQRSHAAMYESTIWEGLIVCQVCRDAVTRWLIDNDLLDQNPFAQAMLDDGESTQREGYYRVWIQNGVSSFTDRYVERIK